MIGRIDGQVGDTPIEIVLQDDGSIQTNHELLTPYVTLRLRQYDRDYSPAAGRYGAAFLHQLASEIGGQVTLGEGPPLAQDDIHQTGGMGTTRAAGYPAKSLKALKTKYRRKAEPQPAPEPQPVSEQPPAEATAPASQLDPPLAQALAPKQGAEQAAPPEQSLAQYDVSGSRILPPRPPPPIEPREDYQPQIDKTREYYRNRPDYAGHDIDAYSGRSASGKFEHFFIKPQNFQQLLKDHGPEVLEQVGTLMLGGRGGDVASLFKNPEWLNHVSSLDFRGAVDAPLSSREVLPIETILEAPQLSHLRELIIEGYLLGADGLRELANTPNLRNLRALSLRRVDARGGAEALIQSPYLQNLERLTLIRNQFTPEEVRALKRHFGKKVVIA